MLLEWLSFHFFSLNFFPGQVHVSNLLDNNGEGRQIPRLSKVPLRHKESGHLDREVYKEMIPLISQGLEKNTTFTAVYPSQLSKDLVKGHERYYDKDLQSEQLSDNAPGVSHFKDSYATLANRKQGRGNQQMQKYGLKGIVGQFVVDVLSKN